MKQLYTVKLRKQEHSKIRTCTLILWKKTPKSDRGICLALTSHGMQCDLGVANHEINALVLFKNLENRLIYSKCSDEIVHLVGGFCHVSASKFPTIDN